MHVPALDAELSLVGRAGFAGYGIDDLTVQHFEVKVASASAIGAGRQYGLEFHRNSFFSLSGRGLVKLEQNSEIVD
jgi:hypothetical protein